jgi:hypothetical protein
MIDPWHLPEEGRKVLDAGFWLVLLGGTIAAGYWHPVRTAGSHGSGRVETIVSRESTHL